MANPLLIPGTLNRVRGQLIVAGNAALNITASYLGKEGISISADTELATTIPLLVSTTNSMEPYQMVTVTAHIVKSMGLCTNYLNQIRNSSVLGTVTVVLDTGNVPNFTIYNAVIVNWQQLSAAGTQADFPLTIRGYFVVNNELWG